MPVQTTINTNLPVCRLKAKHKHLLPESLLLMALAVSNAAQGDKPANFATGRLPDSFTNAGQGTG
jgi:hypothetical protein